MFSHVTRYTNENVGTDTECVADHAKDSPDAIGPDGTLVYFANVGVDVEQVEVLVASEIIQSPSLGEMTREGFLNGWSSLK